MSAMTDETQDFIQKVHTDAYAALLTSMRADAWTLGYEAARRDITRLDPQGVFRPEHPLYEVVAKLHELSYGDLRRRANRELTDAANAVERRHIEALATLGPLFPMPPG